jgi:chromosomal replication initiator protein
MNNEQLWQAVLGELELLISKVNFTTWFKNTFISDTSDDSAIIATPNAFTKTWLEKKYSDQISQALKNITNNSIRKVTFLVETKKPANAPTKQAVDAISSRSENPASSASTDLNKFGLNKKYVFENFIVGKNNELAHAASRAVSEKMGEAYNPLFLYGGVGLGKTHLVQAIGNALLQKNPKLKILYINSETFTNDYVQAIKTGRIDAFKAHYRGIDVLLIDDIHFIAGKEQTQEEFFHTFNALHQNNKQIVLTSDRPPKAIPDIEQRLISRFEWGMTADIGAPDMETRMAILQAKCQEKEYPFTPEIIEYLAKTIQSNVRELEGALNRLMAYHQLNNLQPTVESAKQVLQALTASAPKDSLTPKKIIEAVSSYFDIAIEDLVGNCRRKELVNPRQIVMYLMREEIKSSYPSIGQELGGKDHTTAIHACNKISEAIKTDSKTQNDVTILRQRLYSH